MGLLTEKVAAMGLLTEKVITFSIVLYNFLVFAMNNTNLNYMKFQRQL